MGQQLLDGMEGMESSSEDAVVHYFEAQAEDDATLLESVEAFMDPEVCSSMNPVTGCGTGTEQMPANSNPRAGTEIEYEDDFPPIEHTRTGAVEKRVLEMQQ